MSAIEAQLAAILEALGMGAGDSSAYEPVPPASTPPAQPSATPPAMPPMPVAAFNVGYVGTGGATTYPPPLPGGYPPPIYPGYGSVPYPPVPPSIDENGARLNGGWDSYFKGRGFAPYETVLVTSGGYFVTTAQTDVSGSFTATIRIPEMPGTYVYVFTGQTSGRSAQAVIYVE